MVTETDWAYSGDVNLEYGGLFVNLDNVRYGYADVVEVTDLDSACGAAGMVLIEKGSVTIKDRLVPYTVFIDPQLGRVGLSEEEARAQGRNFKVAKMPMNYVARADEIDQRAGKI